MNNRSKNVLKILLILIIVLSCQKVFAAEGKAYHVGDHFYFNPVENKTCNYKNYWTTINQNTTCYQFTVIAESASSSTTVK